MEKEIEEMRGSVV